MQQIYRRWWLALALTALLGLAGGLAGCASSDAVPQCTDDFDCEFGESCNRDEGTCEIIDFGRPGPQCASNTDCRFGEVCNVGMGRCEPLPSSEPDAGIPNTPGTPDADTPDVQQPPTCNPACGPNQTCQSGQCVNNPNPNACNPACGPGQTCQGGQCVNNPDPNACNPACGPDQTCEQGQCVDDGLPQCTRQDAACDPSIPDQGTFWCLTLRTGGGICSNKCQEEYTPIGCARGQICINFADEGYAPALGCLSSQCTTDADCDANLVCQSFENDFKGCVDPTDPGGGQQGQPCTLWQSNNCPSNQVCKIVSGMQGVCTSSIDPGPENIFDRCSPTYDMCGQLNDGTGVECLQNSGQSYSCFAYCRTNQDCYRFEGLFDNYTCYIGAFNSSTVGVCTSY